MYHFVSLDLSCQERLDYDTLILIGSRMKRDLMTDFLDVVLAAGPAGGYR